MIQRSQEKSREAGVREEVGQGAGWALCGQERPFSEEWPTDGKNGPSKGRKSFPGRGSSMVSGSEVAKRNRLGAWNGPHCAGLKQGGGVGASQGLTSPSWSEGIVGTVLTCIRLPSVVEAE